VNLRGCPGKDTTVFGNQKGKGEWAKWGFSVFGSQKCWKE